MNFQDIFNTLTSFFGKPSPTPTPTVTPRPSPSPTLQPFVKTSHTINGVETVKQPVPRTMGAQAASQKTSSGPVTPEQISRGWSGYGGAPAASASATFAEVANKYPILQKYPGLLPAMSMKESSGGKANTKNWFNWGIYEPSYQEGDPNQVIRDVAAAIGSDSTPSSHYYQKFRQTGNIRDMLDRYAPPTENDTGLYHKQLMDWMKMFEQR